MGTHKTVRNILAVQVAGVAFFSVAAAGWAWFTTSDARSRLAAVGNAADRADAALREARQGISRFVSSSSPTDRTASEARIAEARQSLIELQSQSPSAGPAVEQTVSALGQLEGAACDVWSGVSPEARAKASETLEPRAAAVWTSLKETEGILRNEILAVNGRTTWVFLVLWGAAFLVYLGTGFAARRVDTRQRAEEALVLSESLSSIRQAYAIAQGGRAPAVRTEEPTTQILASAVAETAETLAALHWTLMRERERASLVARLADALDLSDTEPEVLATVIRAGGSAFGGLTFQVLLADNSQASLVASLPGECACAPGAPQSCPAVRKGRTLRHDPGEELGRCPRLTGTTSLVACTPVTVSGRAVGAAQLFGPGLEDRHVEVLRPVAAALGTRLGVVRTIGDRELQASTDVLTGLLNRRAMNEKLTELDRSGAHYAVIAADLDHFKRLNDTYGHEVGDRCLKLFGQVLRDTCRAGDLPCRPGGEEFTIVLPGATLAGAAALGERIRAALADASRRVGLAFTSSFGVAARSDPGDTADMLLAAADRALYDAKEAGRDRVVAPGLESEAPASEPTPGISLGAH